MVLQQYVRGRARRLTSRSAHVTQFIQFSLYSLID